MTAAPAPPPASGACRPPHPTGRRPAPKRSQRLLANRAVRDAIVSLAGIIGRPVRNQTGAEIGRLGDVVCRWTGDETYPRVTGLVVKIGRRLAFVGAAAIDTIHHDGIVLSSARLDLVDFVPRPRRDHLVRPGARPPAGGRGRCAGHPGRRPLPGPGVRALQPGRRGHLRPEPSAAPGPGPVAAPSDARTGSSTGAPSSPSATPSRVPLPKCGCGRPTRAWSVCARVSSPTCSRT